MTTLAPSFGERHFGTADLGHAMRNRGPVKIADAIHRHPGGTLPHELYLPKDDKAMDRLMNRPEGTHASVLPSHCQRTLDLLLVPLDQRPHGERTAGVGTDAVVRMSRGHRRISQRPKDRLRHRRPAIHQRPGVATDDRIAERCGGDAVESARSRPRRSGPRRSMWIVTTRRCWPAGVIKNHGRK